MLALLPVAGPDYWHHRKQGAPAQAPQMPRPRCPTAGLGFPGQEHEQPGVWRVCSGRQPLAWVTLDHPVAALPMTPIIAQPKARSIKPCTGLSRMSWSSRPGQSPRG